MKKLRLFTTTALALVLCAGTAQAGWEEGRAAFQKGDLNQAANEFKAVVDGQPDWPGGHFMLGWTYLRMNRDQDAITHLRKAYDLDKNNAAYQLRLGEAYVKAGRYSDAVGFLSKINPSSLPKDMQAFLAQLKAVAKSKSGQSALGELGAAVKLEPNNANLQYQYGAAALNEGQTDTAIRALEAAVRLDSGDADKQRALANAYLRKGRTTRGSGKTGHYQKAVGAAQKVVARSASYDNLMLLGGAQLGAKQYDGAISTFQQAAGKNSTDWLPHYYIGQAYTSKSQFRSAEGVLKTALDHASAADDRRKVWGQLAFVYEKQKKYSEAIDFYNKAGNSPAVARVTKNRDTEAENRRIEEENKQIRQLEEEKRKLEEELKNLPGAKQPGR